MLPINPSVPVLEFYSKKEVNETGQKGQSDESVSGKANFGRSLNSKKNCFFYLTMSPQSSSHTEKEDDKKSLLNDQGNLLAPWRGSK